MPSPESDSESSSRKSGEATLPMDVSGTQAAFVPSMRQTTPFFFRREDKEDYFVYPRDNEKRTPEKKLPMTELSRRVHEETIEIIKESLREIPEAQGDRAAVDMIRIHLATTDSPGGQLASAPASSQGSDSDSPGTQAVSVPATSQGTACIRREPDETYFVYPGDNKKGTPEKKLPMTELSRRVDEKTIEIIVEFLGDFPETEAGSKEWFAQIISDHLATNFLKEKKPDTPVATK